jgi:hypothetical protein
MRESARRAVDTARRWYTLVLFRLNTRFLLAAAGLIAVAGVEIVGLALVWPTATLSLVAVLFVLDRVRAWRRRRKTSA